jgi:hypothetical protein
MKLGTSIRGRFSASDIHLSAVGSPSGAFSNGSGAVCLDIWNSGQ